MKLGIVVPCFNEEDVIQNTLSTLLALIKSLTEKGKIASTSGLYLVDDGSTDNTWQLIEEASIQDNHIHGIKLSANRGHQNALLAGLFTVEGDVIISIDADLQDDIQIIETMIDHYNTGSQIVYGVRKSRSVDTLFKRMSAVWFYRLMRLLGAEIINNHADYRLMSRKAITVLRDFKEVNLFLRGIVPMIGFRTSVVYYDRSKRDAGESKYPLRKMITFALDGLTSFSIVPLRIITFLGFSIFFITICLSIWVIGVRFLTDNAIPGWASTVLPIYLISGLQILCIGILGEYLGKIYSEVKARPRYIIEKII